MFFNLLPESKEIKRERIEKAINFVAKLFSYITDNKQLIGYIILIFHWLFVVFEFGFFSLLFNVNIKTIILIFLTLIIHLFIHLYYGGNGCIFTRLERHFFNNSDWYGPITIIYKILGIKITDKDKYTSEIIHIIAWILLSIFIVYKIYKTYKSNNIDTTTTLASKPSLTLVEKSKTE
jgi:hypothetical protein